MGSSSVESNDRAVQGHCPPAFHWTPTRARHAGHFLPRNTDRLGRWARARPGLSVGPASRACVGRGVPSAWAQEARHWLLRRCMGDRSEDGDRGCGKPVEMGQDVFDDCRVFDARESLDRATTVLAGPDVDLEYPRQTLRLTLIETWRAGAGSLAVCALRRPRLAGVTCSRHRWFGAETP